MTRCRWLVAGAVALALFAPPLAAQDRVPERLRDRVPGEVLAVLEALSARAIAAGLPVEPLTQKAMEGAAKGVPPDRIIAALRELGGRLETAARVLRGAGIAGPEAAGIEAGAFALGTGVSESQLVALARHSRPPYTPDQTLRVAGALVVLGVPADEATTLLVQLIEAGRPATEVLAVPARVRAGVAGGATPAEAARGIGRPPVEAPRGPPPQKPGGPPAQLPVDPPPPPPNGP